MSVPQSRDSLAQTGGPAHPPASGRRTVTPAQLAWLDRELVGWRREGIVTDEAVGAIRSRYVAVRRVTLLRVVLGLGAAFVTVGLIWLVAANLDRFAPTVRFGFVTLVWLALVAVAEWLATRAEREHDVGSPVVGAARLLAAGSFAAVVFQAAQSLQVPAYDVTLLGWSALGVLAYAYAVSGVAPLVLGVAGLSVWFVWEVGEASDGMLAFSASALVGALAAASIGAAHRAAWRPEFAPAWREAAAALALVGLFVAAIPRSADAAVTVPWTLVAGAVLAGALAIAALLLGARWEWAEVELAFAGLAAAILLSVWRTEDLEAARVGAGGYARAAAAVAAYLLLATGYAALGAVRDSTRLTVIATGAVAVFVTFQAFAVFAPILSGSALFLTTGVVLIVSGILADRGRRRLLVRVDLAEGAGGGS